MEKEEQRKLTEEIVETAYKLLTHKLAYGGVTAKNESSFQLELGHIIKTLGQLYEFRIQDKFHLEFETYIELPEISKKSNSNRARVDLLLTYGNGQTWSKAAIELKFFKKENHREPHNRYDVFKDLYNLEKYKHAGIDLCYFFLATDHLHYVDQPVYSAETADFDFRDKKEYKAGTILKYKALEKTISLNQSYAFKWDRINDLYFLKVKI